MTAGAPRRFWRRFISPQALTGVAIIVGWVGMWVAYQGHLAGLIFALATTAMAYAAVTRGRLLSRRQAEDLRNALAAADTRNVELDTLRRLATSTLGGTSLSGLLAEIAEAARTLLSADTSIVTMVVEEGRFLRVEAANGVLGDAVGQLIPVDNSISGQVILQDEPLLLENIQDDPRVFRLPGLTSPFRNAAMVPLRSAGFAIGTLAVINRQDGAPFTDRDLQLLHTLAGQAVMGVDRAVAMEDMQRNERSLAAKNRELERAAALKGEFLANISHELRTPLNSIIGFSDLLLTESFGELNEQEREFLEAILRNGRHLLGLINSVLDLSKIEAGRMTLELTSSDVREAIAGAVTDTAGLRLAKQQECSVNTVDEALVVVADNQRVRQILFNLLANASKFTPAGGRITVSAVRTRAPLPIPSDRAGDRERLVTRDAVWVAVSDDGVGIRPEDMPKLFLEFSQVDSSTSRRQQGTGLGLALCKRFVEMHGGTIGAESVFGKGSTFWFLLPVEGPVRRAVHPPAEPALPKVGNAT